MAFPCPRCGDRYTQSLPMAYASGTYVRDWRSASGYWGTTVSQSILSNLSSPPVKRSVWKPLLAVLFVSLWFAPMMALGVREWSAGFPPPMPAPIIDGSKIARGRHKSTVITRVLPSREEHIRAELLLLGGGGIVEGLALWWLVRNLRYNRTVYPELLRAWRLCFLCQQCGAVFYPPDAAEMIFPKA